MLFRNTMAQSASFALGYLFSFLLAPLMISRLGLDAFGVWAVTGALATYAGLLDLGVGRSLSRFIAIYDARGDHPSICECLGLGVIVVAVVGLAATLVAVLVAPLLSDSLGVLDHEEMRLVLVASVAIWSFSGLDGVCSSVGIGMQEMVPPNLALAAGAVLNFAFSIVALLSSHELTVYAGANALAAFLAIGPSLLAMRRVRPGTSVLMPSRELVREVIGFSLKNQLAWFADLINFQTDKLIIALIVDVHAVAVYEIGSRVVYAVRSLAVMSVSAIVPTVTARIVSEGFGVIAETYRAYTTRVCATTFPVFALAAVTAPFLLVTWLGSVPGDAGLLVPLLSLVYLVNVTTGVGNTLAVGAGMPGMAATNSVQIAVANVILTVPLAIPFGLWGVIAGTGIATVVGSMAFNRRFLRVFGLPSSEFWEGVLPAAGLTLACAIVPGILAIAVGLPAGRGPALALLAVSTLAFGLPYWYLASRRRLLPAQLALRIPRWGSA